MHVTGRHNGDVSPIGDSLYKAGTNGPLNGWVKSVWKGPCKGKLRIPESEHLESVRGVAALGLEAILVDLQ
jgi:hypothetical protein